MSGGTGGNECIGAFGVQSPKAGKNKLPQIVYSGIQAIDAKFGNDLDENCDLFDGDFNRAEKDLGIKPVFGENLDVPIKLKSNYSGLIKTQSDSNVPIDNVQSPSGGKRISGDQQSGDAIDRSGGLPTFGINSPYANDSQYLNTDSDQEASIATFSKKRYDDVESNLSVKIDSTDLVKEKTKDKISYKQPIPSKLVKDMNVKFDSPEINLLLEDNTGEILNVTSSVTSMRKIPIVEDSFFKKNKSTDFYNHPDFNECKSL